MARDWEDAVFDAIPWLMGSLLLLCVVALGFFIAVVAPADARASRACLQRGYPRAQLDWTLQGYCVKREGLSDVVVPL